jgi:hypothetical protein
MKSFLSASALILAGIFLAGLLGDSGSLRHATHLVVGVGAGELIAVGAVWLLTMGWWTGK